MHSSDGVSQTSVKKAPHIVVIDDNEACLSGFQVLLESFGVRVSTYSSLTLSDLSAVANDRPCVAFIDYRMERGISGEDCVVALQSRSPHTKCVVLTGDTSEETRAKMESAGCTVLHKPASPKLIKNEVFSKLAYCPHRDPVTNECSCDAGR